MITVELISAVDPGAIERAKRVEHAMMLLRNGTDATTARRLICQRYQCSYTSGWRAVSIAMDMV